MKVKIECASITEISCDLLVVNEFEGVKHPGGATGAIDKALGGLIGKLSSSGEIDGKLGSSPIIHTQGKIKADRVAVAGLGERRKFDLDSVREAAAAVIKKAKGIKARRVATIVHGAGIGGLDPAGAAEALVQGSVIGNYEYKEFKSKKESDFEIEELIVVDYDPKKVKEIEKGAELGEDVAHAVNRARDFVNGPSNKVTPTYLADYAGKMASYAGLECEILGPKDIEKIGMHSILAVAKGSREEARVVILKYNAKSKSETIGLAGKGVTFDAGGISIKPSKGLSEMKTDMAGAAAVIEIMGLLSKLKINKSVIAVVPLTENMPGSGALKPGDIVSSLEGKSVEIISTDAEGRMILSDALTYARKLGARKLIDVATLTGGCEKALGDVAAGVFGSDKKFLKEVISAGERAGEKMWELPMYEEYKEYFKSDAADMQNCSEGGKASPSVGALYLQEFTGDVPWVHIDIAGTAYLDKGSKYFGKGATGAGVRTVIEFLLKG
jgi:leucyl aminopeptidase